MVFIQGCLKYKLGIPNSLSIKRKFKKAGRELHSTQIEGSLQHSPDVYVWQHLTCVLSGRKAGNLKTKCLSCLAQLLLFLGSSVLSSPRYYNRHGGLGVNKQLSMSQPCSAIRSQHLLDSCQCIFASKKWAQ